MANSKEAFASQALGLLRENPVNDFDEGSTQADICKLFYEGFVENVLTRYPWSFATKKRQLNQATASPVNKWKYGHIIPAEALKLWAFYPTGQAGGDSIKEYDIQAQDGTRMVLSNYPTLWCDYTYYNNEANWPGYFVDFFIHGFAALIAMPVTDKPDLHDRWRITAWGQPSENELGGKYGVAARLDAFQKPGQQLTDVSFLEAARFS